MAADPDWLGSLPESWSFGITQGGRLFFINEEAKSTTWLHPVTGEAVLTGHRKSPDLPTGWEEGYTFEGARYYINHNERKVTCKHPVTAQPSQDNCIFVVNEQSASTLASQEKKDRTVSMTSNTSNCSTGPAAPPSSPLTRVLMFKYKPVVLVKNIDLLMDCMSYTSGSQLLSSGPANRPGCDDFLLRAQSSRSSRKVHNFGKRSNSIKRNPNAPVTMRSWLFKKSNSGMKLWRKRWFVLSDLCLFYYRDEKEEGVLGSILLPSFHISMVTPEDSIYRAHAFKATHSNMRTYYFCTDTAREMELWMKAMTDASLVHSEPTKRVDGNKMENSAPQDINHIANHRVLIRPETNNNQKNRDLSRAEEKKALEAERYGFQHVGQDRPLTKITSVRPQPGTSDYERLAATTGHYRLIHTNGPENRAMENQVHVSETDSSGHQRSQAPLLDADRVIERTNSMLQLEQWIRTQRDKDQEEETRGVMSYQTMPRNMPSYRAQTVPRYPEGYKTLPRNLKTRPESLCSTTGTVYDRTLGPASLTSEEKRRSIRDDTMWQLYEWQQRQFYNKQTTLRRHTSLTSPKTMIHISDQTLHSIPMSPSHGSISGYHTYSPHRAYRSEVSSPVQVGDLTIDRRQRALPSKQTFAPDRRSMPMGLSLQPITSQGLQGKTPEELTLLLIKLRRQQAELSSIREHTVAQLLHLNQPCSPKNEILSHHLQRNLIYVDHQMKENEPLITMVHTMIENSALRPQLFQQMTQEDGRATVFKHRPEEVDIDAKLSSLCEQDKVVQALEQKVQLLHKEKYTVEQALLSASQEIELNADNPAAIQSVILQRDDLQSGLLSTCREVTRATAELERAWRDYDQLERDVTVARNQMRDQLERLGEVQTESAGIQRAQMQKEIWRIQDVMEGLSKHKQQRRSAEAGNSDSNLFSSGKSTDEEEEIVPPRPPLPRSYDFPEQAPTVPPLPIDGSSSSLSSSRAPVLLPDDKTSSHVQVYQRNGSHCGPDYRLYKSEPELTTVAEVDESNTEEKGDASLDLEGAGGKGSHFPVGVVPPRAKSPQLESTTIASYVTLRKSKKMETKTERPRSAVEHLCIADTPRTRMTLEEQLERMKRHQQACLREKKKGINLFGASDQSPSRSPSFSRENSLKVIQMRRREDKLFSNIKDIENAMRENNLEKQRESPAQEIMRLKEAGTAEEPKFDKEPEDTAAPESFVQSDAKDKTEEVVGQLGPVQTLGENSLQVVSSVTNHKTESRQSEDCADEQGRPGSLFSYEFSAESLRRHTALEETPTLPAPAAQPQLAESSHFMCV